MKLVAAITALAAIPFAAAMRGDKRMELESEENVLVSLRGWDVPPTVHSLLLSHMRRL